MSSRHHRRKTYFETNSEDLFETDIYYYYFPHENKENYFHKKFDLLKGC